VPPEPPVSYDEIPANEVASGRLLAAVAYLPGLFVIGLMTAPENRYVGFHSRQGFLLLTVEIAAWIAIAIYDASLGRIPLVGFLVGAVVKFAAGMTLLAATAYGVVKGAGGEIARIPYLGDAVPKVPF
jgi:uncharacterized membrane protein